MRRFIRISFYFLSLTCVVHINAQSIDTDVDSLKSAAEGGSEIQKVVIYSNLMYMLSYHDVLQSANYGKMAIELAEKLDNDTLIIYAHQTAARTYSEWGQNIEALEHSKITIQKQQEIGDELYYFELNNIGDIYLALSDYEQAYKAYQESLKISKEIEDEEMIAISMFNIGRVYKVQSNYSMALEYINSSKSISRKIGDVKGIAYSDHEMGIISHLKGDLNRAIEYLSAAISLSDSLNLYHLSAQSMAKIASVYKGQKNFLKSLDNYHRALNQSQSIKDNLGIAEAYLGLGSLQLEMNSIESASESLFKGLGYAENLSSKELTFKFYQNLSSMYEKKGNQKEALDYFKKFKALSDSVFNKDINIQLTLMETQFETEKKDKEIAQLNESTVLQNSKIAKQSLQATILIFGLIFLLVMVIVVIFIGINRRKANDMLRQQKEMIETKNLELRKLNKVKDKFFSIISHDLKSPFQSLSGILELMSINVLSDLEVKKLFKELKLKFDGTNALLENLLEWARMQMKETKFLPDELELYKTIEEELVLIENSKSKKMVLKNNVEKLSLAYADLNMLKLVIRNLVSNAIKFTNTEGNIEVLSEEMGDFVCISVKDDGMGISEENLEKIFNGGSNITTLGTELETGTGFGLNLCKEFIEMHGGKIWVESEEGKGSVFKFTLKKAS